VAGEPRCDRGARRRLRYTTKVNLT
jgi:hypothetical protein